MSRAGGIGGKEGKRFYPGIGHVNQRQGLGMFKKERSTAPSFESNVGSFTPSFFGCTLAKGVQHYMEMRIIQGSDQRGERTGLADCPGAGMN